LSNDYLDALLAVREAGFLDEYVAHYHRRPGWQVPESVDASEFARWKRRELSGHRPQTRIIGSWNYARKAVGEPGRALQEH
jgi:hypothetical protein